MAKPKFKIKHSISKKEWNKTHKDFKSIIDGVHYVMKLTDKGTALVPVNIKESVDENFAVHMAVAKAIKDAKVKNPDTKKDVKVTTALKDKKHPAHKQAKSLFQRIKDKVMGEGVITEVERGDIGYVEKHKSIATVYGVMGKKLKVKLGKTGKVVTIDSKDIQILPESVNEAMVKPKSGHTYYQLTKDFPVKYITGKYGMGLDVPGVLIKNKSGYIDGKKGAYLIDYFGAMYYVDMKKKFASPVYSLRDQDKFSRGSITQVDMAPEHSDWKKYLKEDVNEGKDFKRVKKDKYGNHLEPQFKKGDKVKYLGNKAVITKVNREMGGVYSYDVDYYKGNGRTKASNIFNKDGKTIQLESVNEGKDPEIITQLRDVVKNGYKTLKDPKSGKRMKVDTYSASAIVGVYDKLNPSNKEKFVKQGLLGMQSLAFKFIK